MPGNRATMSVGKLFADGVDARPARQAPAAADRQSVLGKKTFWTTLSTTKERPGPASKGILLTRKTRAALGWKKRYAILTGDALQVYRNDKSGQLKLTLYAHHLTIQTVGVRGGHGAASAVTRGAPADSRFGSSMGSQERRPTGLPRMRRHASW